MILIAYQPLYIHGGTIHLFFSLFLLSLTNSKCRSTLHLDVNEWRKFNLKICFYLQNWKVNRFPSRSFSQFQNVNAFEIVWKEFCAFHLFWQIFLSWHPCNIEKTPFLWEPPKTYRNEINTFCRNMGSYAINKLLCISPSTEMECFLLEMYFETIKQVLNWHELIFKVFQFSSIDLLTYIFRRLQWKNRQKLFISASSFIVNVLLQRFNLQFTQNVTHICTHINALLNETNEWMNGWSEITFSRKETFPNICEWLKINNWFDTHEHHHQQHTTASFAIYYERCLLYNFSPTRFGFCFVKSYFHFFSLCNRAFCMMLCDTQEVKPYRSV